MVNTSRFQHADRYASYLKTLAGRLRSELAWQNLRCCLPQGAATRRALDVGGGTGFASVKLAEMGFEVVLLDRCEEMLSIAKQQTEASSATGRISFCHADADRLHEFCAAGSFDVVVCHNVLEYLENPHIVIRHISGVMRENAVVSVLVRNRAGEVLRAAINSGDWELAKTNLSAETVSDSLYGEPVRIFAPEDVCGMLANAGLRAVAEQGVRVFSDYLDLPDDVTGDAYQQVFELERTLGAQPEFAAIARYTQVIARRSSASSGKGPAQ